MHSGELLGYSFRGLGCSLGGRRRLRWTFGVHLGSAWGLLGALRGSWIILGGSLGTPRELLGGSWGLLGRCWDILVAPGALLRGSLGALGGSLGALLGSWGVLGGPDEKTKSSKT